MGLSDRLQDSLGKVEEISENIRGIANDASPETEEQVEHEEEEQESKLEKLVKAKRVEKRKQIIRNIFSELDRQNWEKAQGLMEANIENEPELIKGYIRMRFMKGQEKLSEVKKGMKAISGMTDKAGRAINERNVTEAVVKISMVKGTVESINEGNMLDAQRKITQGAKAAERFNYQRESFSSQDMVKIAERDVDDIRKLDQKMEELTKRFEETKEQARELAEKKGIPFTP